MTVSEFSRDRRGTVGVMFGLMLVPLVGLAGAAIDYARLAALRESLHSTSDQIALAIAASDDPAKAEGIRIKTEADLRAKYPDQNIKIGGEWVDVSNYKVTVSGKLKLAMAQVIPGVGDDAPVSLVTVANRVAPKMRALPPSSSLLEPEAGDYNRAYMYCFDPARKNDPDKGRRDFWPIADNASPSTDFKAWYESKATASVTTTSSTSQNGNNGNGHANGHGNNGNGNNNGNNGNNNSVNTSSANNILGPTRSHGRNGDGTAKYRLPDCKSGEFPAYMMRNVRNSRTNSGVWDRDNDYYEYFTDTVIDPATYRMTNSYVGEYVSSNKNRSAVDLVGRPMLETILCDTQDQCKPGTVGSKIRPRQTGRSPDTATGGCTKGKYMYFGYEDRPQNAPDWGDRDYDDIRIVISCPDWEQTESKKVRIVQ